MEFIISAATDVGLVRKVNQDSFGAKLADTRLGKIAFAVLCDGMGGFSKGEAASATVVDAFQRWMLNRLPLLCESGITDAVIRDEWETVVMECNQRIQAYGQREGIHLGTTLSVLMLTETRYYIMNIGDSRVYEITGQAVSLTKDQTVVQREVEQGILSEEQARTDPRRHILLQCVGASRRIVPEMQCGETRRDTVYMLCSDGFRGSVTPEEIHHFLNPSVMYEAMQMQQNMDALIALGKQRRESDNMTAVSVRAYEGEDESTEVIAEGDMLPVLRPGAAFTVTEEFSYTSSHEII